MESKWSADLKRLGTISSSRCSVFYTPRDTTTSLAAGRTVGCWVLFLHGTVSAWPSLELKLPADDYVT